MVLRSYFCGLLLCLSALLHAQSSTGFHIQQYGTEDGLPSNGIKGLQWDSKTGFLWIATEAGLVRYNGMSFKTYTNEDNTHITNERILFLIRNNAGTIYTADNTGNIFSVSKNTLSFIKKANIAGNTFGNIITLGISESFYSVNHQITNGPFAVQFDRVLPVNDTAGFIHRGNQLFYFTREMKTPVLLSLPLKKISSTFRCDGAIFAGDGTGKFWQISEGGARLSPVEFAFAPGARIAANTGYIFIWENGMNHPLLLDGDNAWKISFQNERLTATLICNQMPRDALIRYAQYDEATHTLFLGTDSKGIVIIKKNLVEPMRKERTTASQRTSYYSQLELPDGNVLTNEGHVLGKNSPDQSDPPIKGVFSIGSHLVGDSVFWFVQTNRTLKKSCLHSYNLKTGRLTPYAKVGQGFAQLVMTSSGGKIYLANENGIYRLDGDTAVRLYQYPGENKLRIHFGMQEIAPGVLALANCNSLLRFDTRTNRLDTLFVPGNYCVRSIWQYKDYLFFGTYGNGFYIMKNGRVKRMPLDKNRHLLFTHCFINDEKGYCWISTNRGLFKASIAELINAYETDVTQVYYHYFGRRDGMDMTEMNGGCTPCGLVLKDKTISFPTMEGLLWVNPQSAEPVLPAGEIFIDEILLNNRRISMEELEKKPLGTSGKDMIIRLGFSAWCNKENIYLEYQLNDDTEWKPVNIDNGAIIQLNNLSWGNYVLKIRKLNGFGLNNFSYKEIRFSIPSPWHQRWWFYILVGFVLFGLLALYFRFRTRQYKLRQRKLEKQVAEKTKELQQQNEILEKNNTIKTRLISIISHDIVTPLKFLTVAGKNLVEKRKQMPEDLQQETIQEMANTSQELQLLSTNILNWIKYQNENRRLLKETFGLHEVVNQVFGVLHSMANQKKIRLVNDTDPALKLYQFQEPLRILLYNLVTNAINFSEQGIISIFQKTANNLLTITVADEGVGMTPEQVQNIMADQVIISSANIDNRKGNGLGYLIIKDLLKMMGATLHIQSEKNKGTRVSVSFPYLK
ncbi:MAG: HAMP domain-containing histidine kinase [Chitinophagaceae bacterium]|nr:HAMP domain-containing histidine kinase [Chitinophagaceae bacterium]